MSENEGSSSRTMNNALNEFHLIKDGILDKDQLNYIVKNPEEPKCKYTITSLLNLYQKEKRKSLSLNDSNVTYKEFKNFVSENLAKSKLTPEAAIKLKDIPDELCERIVECLIDKHAIGNEFKNEKSNDSNSMSHIIQVKKEKCNESSESEEEASSDNTSRNDETDETSKNYEKSSVKRTKAQKNEPSLCESMFYVAVNRAQSKKEKRPGKSRKKSDNLPSLVKEFESLLDKEARLEEDAEKIDTDLENTEKEKKVIEKEYKEAERRFNENMQTLMQALLLCDSLNEARDKAKEQCASVLQRIEDLEELKKRIIDQKSKVDARKGELLVHVIRESSATAKNNQKEDQSESELVNSSESNSKSKNEDDEEREIANIIRKKKLSANKRLQELATELDIGAVRFGESSASDASFVNSERRTEVTESNDKAKTWKDNFVTMSINTSTSTNNSTYSFQEIGETSSKFTETLPRRVSESSTDGNTSFKVPNVAQLPETRKSEKEREDQSRKRPISDTSERRSKITKFVDERPSTSTSTSTKSSILSETEANIDNELIKDMGFNAFRDVANCGFITTIKVHKNFLYIASDTGYLRKFNISNLSNNLFFAGHSNGIQAISLHNITDALYTGCDDGKLRHFDSETANLKDTFHLCAPVTCMEEGNTVLYVGVQSGQIFRFGFMSNKMINSYTVSNSKISAIKLLAEYSEESRIVVCCSNAITIRSSSNGALLNALQNSENIGFIDVTPTGFIYFLSNHPSQGAVLNIRHEKKQLDSLRDGLFIDPNVTAFDMSNNHLYFATYSGRIVCLRHTNDTFELQWVYILPESYFTYVTAFTFHNDTLLAAVNDGTVVRVGMDSNGPHICHEHRCRDKPFARKVDFENHIKLDHWTEAYRGKIYQCHQDNCRSVMSSSEVRNPYHYRPRQNNYYHYPRRGRGYYRRY